MAVACVYACREMVGFDSMVHLCHINFVVCSSKLRCLCTWLSDIYLCAHLWFIKSEYCIIKLVCRVTKEMRGKHMKGVAYGSVCTVVRLECSM